MNLAAAARNIFSNFYENITSTTRRTSSRKDLPLLRVATTFETTEFVTLPMTTNLSFKKYFKTLHKTTNSQNDTTKKHGPTTNFSDATSKGFTATSKTPFHLSMIKRSSSINNHHLTLMSYLLIGLLVMLFVFFLFAVVKCCKTFPILHDILMYERFIYGRINEQRPVDMALSAM